MIAVPLSSSSSRSLSVASVAAWRGWFWLWAGTEAVDALVRVSAYPSSSVKLTRTLILDSSSSEVMT